MTELYKKYKKLNIDGSYIGLEKGDEKGDYFCTPVGAKVIGWDNGIHYCFIKGFGDMVFCVNPETCCDYNVYPLAKSFYDFLSLILAAKNANTLQQIIWWDKSDYESFMADENTVKWAEDENTVSILDKIKKELDIEPMENPFEYVKEVQKDFPYDKIEFSDEYYDTLGIDRPDGKKSFKEFLHKCMPADTDNF